MNILQICSKPPYPEKDGYALAVNHITNSLIDKGHSLKVIAISTPKHRAERVSQQYLQKTDFGRIYHSNSVQKNLLSRYKGNISSFKVYPNLFFYGRWHPADRNWLRVRKRHDG